MPQSRPPRAAAPRAVHRLQLRATAAQRRVLRQAAATARTTVSGFVLDSACSSAYRLLAERPDFLMDDPDWEHFLRLLGQPPAEKEVLKALLTDGA